jgi:nicotinamide riboside kinase
MAPRAHRICLTGPEATGKSQFAPRIAAETGAVSIPEFAREYALRVKRALTADDVEPIARGTIALHDAVDANVVICDTDLLSTVVYARYYYGSCPEWIEREARARRADLYLLLDTDLAWKADPARDAATPEMREDLFDAFRAALDEFDCRWEIVGGPFEERYAELRRLVLAAVGGA